MPRTNEPVEPTLTPSQARQLVAPDHSTTSSDSRHARQVGDDSSRDDHPPDASLPNYTLRRKIGLGGIGEVVLARDTRLDRDVAVKRLRNPNPSPAAVQRFLREAKIQARLDHPAIVPVHEQGIDTHGQPYFTMKRLTGTTLAAHLSHRTQTLQQILRAFVDVCLAVEFAHTRGVVHRDLKPANVMLGDYGEVYVIDWGVARVTGERDVPATEGGGNGAGMTQAGTLLGTPGYMAPEQIENANTVGPTADSYSLGATLFEILAGTPLHPRGGEALATTLGPYDPSPSHRAPEANVAPELDELTVRALATTPADRPTARQLADGVQRYLDGDRDVERRRALSVIELGSAHAALAGGDVARRADAIRSAGRALALDPESRAAAALITRLMLEPPPVHPSQLDADLAASESLIQQKQGRVAVRSLIAVLVFLGAAALSGLRSAPMLAATAAWATLLLVIAYVIARRPARPNEMWIICIGNVILGALLSRMFGPLVITPVVLCIMAVSLTSYPQLMAHARIVIPLLVLAWLGPVILEAGGLLAPTWQVTDGLIISGSRVVELSSRATAALLVGGNVMAIIVVGAFANALARSRREAQRNVEIQAWHLRQLLPAGPA